MPLRLHSFFFLFDHVYINNFRHYSYVLCSQLVNVKAKNYIFVPLIVKQLMVSCSLYEGYVPVTYKNKVQEVLQ
ncbi:hypothetical protein Hanom_Chr12g01162591 [Helianthus anomalus]